MVDYNRDYAKEYYKTHREIMIQKSRQYAATHRAASRQYRLTYYENNKDKQRAYYLATRKLKKPKNISIQKGHFIIYFS